MNQGRKYYAQYTKSQEGNGEVSFLGCSVNKRAYFCGGQHWEAHLFKSAVHASNKQRSAIYHMPPTGPDSNKMKNSNNEKLQATENRC